MSAPTAASPPTPPVDAPGDVLHRLHPLTPILRGFKFFGAVIAIVSVRELSDLGLRRASYALLIAIVVGFALAWLSWRFTWYRVEGRELHVESGVLFRRSRRVPLERVQAIDIVRPLVGRALGLAELRLEVVGGGATEAPLAYLTEDEAHRLRARLLALAAGVDEHAPAPEETVLAQVPTRDLVISVLLLGEVVFGLPLLVLVAGGLLAFDFRAFVASLAVLGSAAVGFGRAPVRRLLGEYGFTLATSPDGLRLRHGLLETRAQTVPPGRIQAIRMVQPLLWRRLDWVRVEVDVAGYGGGQQEQMETRALLPVAPRPVAEHLLARVLGGLDVLGVPQQPAPRAAAWCDPFGWRFLSLGLSDDLLVVRHGRLRRVLDVVPLAKVQSIRLRQGPVQRRLGLASVHVDTAGRHLAVDAAHREGAEALRLVDAISDHARMQRARRRVPR